MSDTVILPKFPNGASVVGIPFQVNPNETVIAVYKCKGNWDVYEYDSATHVIGRYLRTDWYG